jgi:oligopeptide transport system substrate-binding protein
MCPHFNGKYSNKEFDELVNKSFTELDPSKRIEYFKEAERLIVAEDFAVAPIYYQDIQSFRQKGVKGFIIPLYGGYYYLKDTYIVEK